MKYERILVALALCLVTLCSAAKEDIRCKARSTPSPYAEGEYDFVVVGGGTAGLVTATRLAMENHHVLVLETGERLYDSAALSAQYFAPIMTGADLSAFAKFMNPLIKSAGKFTDKGELLDTKGKRIGHVKEGIPGFLPHLQATPFMCLFMSLSEASHYYPTTPQIYSQKREIDYPRGNVLGGSSASNTMCYFRGTDRDFNQWRDEFGLTGWGYEDVLPFFKKFENNVDVDDDRIHGKGGLINVTISKKHFKAPAADEWTKAAIKLGWKKIKDASNPETQYGASDSWQIFAGDNGRRSDTTAYIRHMDEKGKVCWDKKRSECDASQTLHIWTNKLVSKILIDENNRATGVEYITKEKGKSVHKSQSPSKSTDADEGVKHHHAFTKWDRIDVQSKNEILGAPVDQKLAFDWNRGEDQYVPESIPDRSSITHQVTAKYETILSAGTLGTGQILMLSGIGPANHLKERSIKTVVDLPVGQRMQDHQELSIVYKFPKKYDPGFDFFSETAKGFPTLRDHLAGKRTFFSFNQVPAGVEGSSAGPNGTIPKWHLHHLTQGPFENLDFNMLAYRESVDSPSRLPRSLIELYKWTGLMYHSHNCELSQNHAYGKLELRNRDPLQPPFYDPRYGSSDEDNAEMASCIEATREIMKAADPKFVGEELEPSASAKTREQITQWVRNNIWGHHVSGSAPMGSCDYEFAVADHKARVYGVDGLRVSDASLFPSIPHGNPAAVVIMMGEKIAADIIGDYKKTSTTAAKDEL
eukprot:TRINITY_DN1701_c0_g1_i1.p1 TRINITY_DN1701_c0_g1~~TRINITY_DN1701_c0_g1_i1.p1  ORF type:complete len:757 (-),score=226.92 TRINITY_DN1701_c0_g1_i1:37-2307(-)